MCRLFGLHAGSAVSATFWLLDAPDSLSEQSHHNPGGTGLGVFDGQGRAVVRKQPLAAWEDAAFVHDAQKLTGSTFVAHVRYASTGAPSMTNTHPFLQDGRLFAHNGVVEGLDVVDGLLTELAMDPVSGQTDSERVFALVTASIRARRGDIGGGLVDAVGWLAANVPIYALDILLCNVTDMWAHRYPDTHDLFILDRRESADGRRLELHSNRIHAASEPLSDSPSVVFATERMDDDPGWRALGNGELVHVGPDLNITSTTEAVPPPRYRTTMADLSSTAAASQRAR